MNRKETGQPKGFQASLAVQIGISLAIIISLFGAAAFIGNLLQRQSFGTEEVRGDLATKQRDMRTVTYQGNAYSYNAALTTILFMGVDKRSEQLTGGAGFRNGGQTDFLSLMIMNSTDKTVEWLPIDRDTMTQITVLGVLGNEAGTKTAQICLSHGFGDGGAQSAKLTQQAVQTLLYGIDIDFYIAMDMDAITTLNELVGGITVTLEEDFTAIDPTMVKGTTLTLHGMQAEHYVRGRTTVGDGTNESRMKRQAAYLTLLKNKVSGILDEEPKFVDTLFDGLEPFLVTNMKRGRLVNEVYKTQKYQQLPDLTVAGEHVIGEDGFMEFHADAQALEAMVVELFFEPIAG